MTEDLSLTDQLRALAEVVRYRHKMTFGIVFLGCCSRARGDLRILGRPIYA